MKPVPDDETRHPQVPNLDLLLRDLENLAEQSPPPQEYYREFLQRALWALAGQAGAVYLLTAENNVRLQFQSNLAKTGLLNDAANLARHNELLVQSLRQTEPIFHPPRSAGPTDKAGNSTGFFLLLAVVWLDGQAAGLVEVFLSEAADPDQVQGGLQMLGRLAQLASFYLREQQRRQLRGDQQLWSQLEGFGLRLQGSLQPTEVSYLVANEGRQLIGCDRLSVALRNNGKRTLVTAISGAETVERRSKLVLRLQALAERVFDWGEKLVYNGVKEDDLPPKVLAALDVYLEESASKLLVVVPLRIQREKASPLAAHAALVLECFEPPTGTTEALLARLDVVGRYGNQALANALQVERIPLRWLWEPLARVQEGLGGKTRAIVAGASVALLLLLAVLVYCPYPLKLDAKGQLLPEERCWVYSPVEGKVVRFEDNVQPGSQVYENQALVLLYDVQLEIKLVQLNSEILAAQQEVQALVQQLAAAATESERLRLSSERQQKQAVRDRKNQERSALRERTQSDPNQPGRFWLKAPMNGTILNSDYRETLTNRFVRPVDPLLLIGAKDKSWEVQLRIPQRHIGQVLGTLAAGSADAEHDVELLLLSEPTRVFKGKLARSKIASEANPSKSDPADPEPTVLAWVRIDGPDIAPADRIPRDIRVASTEVHAKIRCGQRALGFSLFYGLWEFFYEKVVFFF